jgi:hypothetical protein
MRGDPNMKLFPRFIVAASLVLTAATGALAEDQSVNANVPFNFAVGDHYLPAGRYTLFSPYSNVVEIRSQDGRLVTFVASTRGFQEPQHGSQLEFKKYGEHYVLHRVLCPMATGMNRVIPTGKREEKQLKREASLEVSSTVLVEAE